MPLRGEGLVTPHRTDIALREIGTSVNELRQIEGKKPKDKQPRHKHCDHKPHRPDGRESNHDTVYLL